MNKKQEKVYTFFDNQSPICIYDDEVGFVPFTKEGVEIDIETQDGTGYQKCGSCGRIIDEETFIVVGRAVK